MGTVASHVASAAIVTLTVAALALRICWHDIKRHWPAARAYLLLQPRETPPALHVDLASFIATVAVIWAAMFALGAF